MAANVTPVKAFTVEGKVHHMGGMHSESAWCWLKQITLDFNKHGVQPGIFTVVTILEVNEQSWMRQDKIFRTHPAHTHTDRQSHTQTHNKYFINLSLLMERIPKHWVMLYCRLCHEKHLQLKNRKPNIYFSIDDYAVNLGESKLWYSKINWPCNPQQFKDILM